MVVPGWLSASIADADSHADPAGQWPVDRASLTVLADRAYRNVPEDVLIGLGTGACIAELRQLWATAQVRTPGTAVVDVRERTDGTAVRIVTDDMPFLVDSVSAELARQGRAIRRLIHPQVVVRRDASGALRELVNAEVGDHDAGGDIAESWMSIELEPDPVSLDGAQTQAGLVAVLRDVRAAVEDWSAMRMRMLTLADEAAGLPAEGSGTHQQADVAAFLRWLADDHLTITGYRAYRPVDRPHGDEPHGDGLLESMDPAGPPTRALAAVCESGLGVLRPQAPDEPLFDRMTLNAVHEDRCPVHLVVAKASSRSTIHRSAMLDVFVVDICDPTGGVVEQHRFVGLLTASAHAAVIDQVPVLRSRFSRVLSALAIAPGSHSARDLQQFWQTYPRDELLQTRTRTLITMSQSVVNLHERRQPKLFVRLDDFCRFVSVLVYLPRDRYTTAVRQHIDALLQGAYSGVAMDYTVLVADAPMARLHCIVHLDANATAASVASVDVTAVQDQVAQAVRSWEDGLVEALVRQVGADEARALLPRYRDAFPAGYREAYDPAHAASDITVIERLHHAPEGDLELRLEGSPGQRQARFTITRIGPAMSLARVLPMLELMGVEVVQERPFEVTPGGGGSAFVLDFILVLPHDEYSADLSSRFTDAFAAMWTAHCEIDAFNALVVHASLTWQDVRVLRAVCRYVRQLGAPYGLESMQEALNAQPRLARLLVEVFHQRLDPRLRADTTAAADRERSLNASIEEELNAVPSLDQDRIIRHVQSVIDATLRTNAYLPDVRAGGALALKLDSGRITGMPVPIPAIEVWVSSPRVEGVHLRRGPVARGGIRWSDRREDFRTEILGLVKAQEVKNAIIIPVGAKGGFVPLRAIDPGVDRQGWAAQGRAAYCEFITALLSITDNIDDGVVVPPPDVVRHDGPDPYLVVAADKGTATFSDMANEIAQRDGFWLGDAFASGGSHGYDHKAMGITARGAWISVTRHFLELGLDPAKQAFTVVGIGDMSGDVFGNGMLLSDQIRLIAAFDHRHIFIDPNPDPSASFAERQRLFGLSRSSWADYDRRVLSTGGDVFERGAKSISLSPQACEALGVDEAVKACTPDDVVRMILKAPAQLLWNGGIGTYIRSSAQSDRDVADRANDAVRITGEQVRCQVIGEGGNLGLTQLGRIEAAQRGVRLNTDAIDNSAGVDTSDHEVNIKILLDTCVRAGQLSSAERNDLLASMAPDVALAVLADNYRQNVVLATARANAPRMASVHQRLMVSLSRSIGLDRSLEGLPDDEEISLRIAAGRGLTSPELAVLLAYVKIEAKAALVDSDLSQDSWFEGALNQYFPPLLVERFPTALPTHPLAARIVATVTANRIVNIGGITFLFRAAEETGANVVDVVRAATAAIAIFGIEQTWDDINNLDGLVPTDAQARLHLELRRLLDRSTRWFLQTRGGAIDIADQVNLFRPIVATHRATVTDSLRGAERRRFDTLSDTMALDGVPRDLAAAVAAGLDTFALLDITELVRRTGAPVDQVIGLYFAISERYDVDVTLVRITSLPRGDRWSALARQALRSDLYAVVASLTLRVLRSTDPAADPDDRIRAWEQAHEAGIRRARATLDEIASQEDVNLATLSVVLRILRTLVAQGGTSAVQGS